jgi:acetyl-CoA carboxylase carboxyl transferase subunit beta
MSWFSNLTPPGIKNLFKRADDGADSLWVKCGGCGEMLFSKDLEAALNVCKSCGHHMKLPAADRLRSIFDDGRYNEVGLPDPPLDPLGFKDERKYVDRIRDARRKTGRQDALIVGVGRIEGSTAVAAVQDFDFMGGSMGMALGEALIRAAETAVGANAPLIVFTASGGARMQEGILSLMQMPRTTIAVQMMREARLPYIVVLTHPTTGGVTASYAMLGDAHLAEPGALIGFAGPRVIEQTIREKLPEGFQRSEFLKDKGMVDLVVARGDLKRTLGSLIRVLMKRGARAESLASVYAGRAAE